MLKEGIDQRGEFGELSRESRGYAELLMLHRIDRLSLHLK